MTRIKGTDGLFRNLAIHSRMKGTSGRHPGNPGYPEDIGKGFRHSAGSPLGWCGEAFGTGSGSGELLLSGVGKKDKTWTWTIRC